MAGRIKAFFADKRVRIVLFALLALLLLFAVWKVFFAGGDEQSGYVPTEREARLLCLIKELGGVRDATAMIREEDGRPVSAVILFEGEDSILLRARILEIAASALGVERSAVGVYPA